MRASPIRRLLAFVQLGRPKFLFGGFACYGLGAALAAREGADMSWKRYACGQAFISATQLMTHYSNDYFDLKADRANHTPTRWSGGSRILTSGLLPPKVALIAAGALAGVALMLVAVSGASPAMRALMLAMVFLSWFYSAPPLRLSARGLGEATTALVVTLLTPLFAYQWLAGTHSAVLVAACLPLCGLQFAMLLTIELPDAAGDSATGKRTLVVRRGADWGARSAALVIAASYLALPLGLALDLPLWVALCGLLPLPLAIWQCRSLLSGHYRDASAWEGLAQRSVLLVALTTLAELLGALLPA